MTALELTKKAARILDEKKAQNIKALNLIGLTSLTDFFLIAEGTSTTHVKALADELETKLKEENVVPMRIEGYNTAQWILIEYAGVIVHIFGSETRNFYALERLWSDAAQVDLELE